MENVHTLWIVLALITVLPTLLAIREYRHRQKNIEYYQLIEGEEMPPILSHSTLLLNEQTIQCTTPVKLKGRVDQVFITKDDILVIVDTKTRQEHRIYEKDIEQVSLYSFILRASGRYEKYKMASQAYIRTVVVDTDQKKTVHYFLINLYDNKKVLETLKEKQKENNHV